MKRLIAGAAIAAGLGFGLAVPAHADTCAFFSPDDPSTGCHQPICGIPNLQQSAQNALTNLQNNLSPQNALGNLKSNLDPSTAGANLRRTSVWADPQIRRKPPRSQCGLRGGFSSVSGTIHQKLR